MIRSLCLRYNKYDVISAERLSLVSTFYQLSICFIKDFYFVQIEWFCFVCVHPCLRPLFFALFISQSSAIGLPWSNHPAQLSHCLDLLVSTCQQSSIFWSIQSKNHHVFRVDRAILSFPLTWTDVKSFDGFVFILFDFCPFVEIGARFSRKAYNLFMNQPSTFNPCVSLST